MQRSQTFPPLSFKMAPMFFLGIASGLPPVMTWHTLNVWLVELGYSKSVLGALFLVGLPYNLKFIWGPIVDHVSLPGLGKLLGRRRSWAVAMQLCTICSLACLGLFTTANGLWLTAVFALLTCTFSAINQVVVNAYRIEMLSTDDIPAGVATSIFGYRIGWLFGSAGALYMAEYIPWGYVYVILSFMIIGSILSILLSKNMLPDNYLANRSEESLTKTSWTYVLKIGLWDPLMDFTSRFPAWKLIVIFLLTYKMGDNLVTGMTNVFYRDIGFSKIDIANITKVFGLVCTVGGGFIGAWCVNRYGVMKTLFFAGLFHGLSHVCLIGLAYYGQDRLYLAITIMLEHTTSGMKATAFAIYVSYLCHGSYHTATDYALIGSIKALSLTFFGAMSGVVVDAIGWSWFFCTGMGLSLMGLLLLYDSRIVPHRAPHPKVM